MNNSLQSALNNLIENKATSDEIELLRGAFVNGQIFIGGNVQNSVIIVGSGNTVQLSPQAVERLAAVNYLSALHELPQPPVDFVGRRKELKKILTNIEKKGGAAISGLIGMAGIGKTVLGLVVAQSLVNKYSDAQFFIDLRGTSNNPLKPIDVMKQVVQSFHPTADLRNATEEELSGSYLSSLAEKKTILFLDNADDASQIMPLQPPRNSLMIVTSRFHFTIPGLHSVELDVLNKSESNRLLTEICPRLTKKDTQRIAELCDNLPLALRIAGSYLQIHIDWSVQEYITELADKTKRLQALHLDGAGVNVTASFEQSYQQLSDDEKHFWGMLSIFPVSFKRDALTAVWSLDEDNARKLVGKLYQYSLLDYDPATDRYRLHDLLRDFANTKLTEEEKASSFLNYLRHYQNVWAVAEEQYAKGGDKTTRALLLFDSEFDHLKEAYRWALANANTNASVSVALANIPKFLNIVGLRLHPNQRLAWFQAVLAAAEKMDDLPTQNLVLGNIGATFNDMAAYQDAIKYYERAVAIAQQIGDREKEGFWLGDIGAAYSNMGQFSKALEYLEQALEIARLFQNQRHESDCLNNIAMTYAALGEGRKAIEYLLQALKVTRAFGNREKEGVWLGNIGAGYINLGENRQALEYLEQALAIAREFGDKPHEGFWLGTIGLAYMNLGEFNEAIDFFEKALEIAQIDGNRLHQHYWRGNIGVAYRELGEIHKGKEYLEQALAIAWEIDDRQSVEEWMGNIGVCFARLGENDEANKLLEEALAIAYEVGAQWQQAQWHNELGELWITMNDAVKAKENLERALKISRQFDVREIAAKSLFNFAKLAELEKNREAALQYAQDARAIFESIESPKLSEVDQFIESLR